VADRPAPSGEVLAPAAVRIFGPEWLYLACALLFGGAFLTLTPPFQVADEENHFRRSCELAEGRVIPEKRGDYTGDNLPRSVEALWYLY